ncbi:MAG: hypothetical protein LBK58_05685 [Prevotellaceae bacterium]|nr:hypothetical protein [Prevotellaceae bacterium]
MEKENAYKTYDNKNGFLNQTKNGFNSEMYCRKDTKTAAGNIFRIVFGYIWVFAVPVLLFKILWEEKNRFVDRRICRTIIGQTIKRN